MQTSDAKSFHECTNVIVNEYTYVKSIQHTKKYTLDDLSVGMHTFVQTHIQVQGHEECQ